MSIHRAALTAFIIAAVGLLGLPAGAAGPGPFGGAAVASADALTTIPATNPSKADVLYRLVPRPGMTGPQVVASIQSVHDMGERAYPALAEALAETDDTILAQEILRAMTDTRGDKTIPARAARKLLARYQSAAVTSATAATAEVPRADGSPSAAAASTTATVPIPLSAADIRVALGDRTPLVMRSLAVSALGQMRRPEDSEVLLRQLDDPDEAVRLAVLRLLPRVCGEDEADRVEVFYANRLANLGAGAIETDRTLIEAKKVVESLSLIPAQARPTTATLAAPPLR